MMKVTCVRVRSLRQSLVHSASAEAGRSLPLDASTASWWAFPQPETESSSEKEPPWGWPVASGAPGAAQGLQHWDLATVGTSQVRRWGKTETLLHRPAGCQHAPQMTGPCNAAGTGSFLSPEPRHLPTQSYNLQEQSLGGPSPVSCSGNR